ncbi:papain fold toxin domain-containing protein [Aerosakkonemataceae cyanobacterium BLCC-F50]|uniref:Papain fold toxin domain-containing protein n=1 Tax=Floridaenema flaviceps BLCC-F50 TaxID=3153642 RepID=A0ABV4XS76_9CYAN
MTQINAEQLLVVRSIASQHENLKCVECASAIEDYLISQGIHGKRIKLYTGDGASWDSRIYDDSIPGDAISVNGRHEGIAIAIDGIETIFDNHHPEGMPKNQWLANLQFHSKILFGQQFQITEESF